MKTLSSAQTFLMKILFPGMWISLFGLGTFGLWSNLLHGKNGSPPDSNMKWIFLIIWVLGTLFVLKNFGTLKKVRVDSKFIYISNYFREIAIPLNMIADVTENRWMKTHPVTVHLAEDTLFGDQVTFIPKFRLTGLFSSHPVVAELKRMAGADQLAG